MSALFLIGSTVLFIIMLIIQYRSDEKYKKMILEEERKEKIWTK